MKKAMPYIKSLIFLVVLGAILAVCEYIYSPSGYARFILHEIEYKNESGGKDYDTIIIGASHTRSAINPEYINQALGCNALNVGIPAETVNDMRYLVPYIAQYNDIKTLIVDVDYQYFYNTRLMTEFSKTFIASQMNPGEIQLSYYWNNRDTIDIRNLFTRRYSYKTLSGEAIKKNVDTKNSEAYKNFDVSAADTSDANGPYVGKGFFLRESNNCEPGGEVYLSGWFGLEDMGVDPEAASDFGEVVKFCNDNGIRLICISSPITPTSIERLQMGVVHEHIVNEVMIPFGVEYYDLNMLQQSVFPRRDWDYGDLEGHMDGEPGQRYSKVLANLLKDVFNGTYKADKYLYSSYEEEYARLKPDFESITGLKYKEGQ